MEEVKLKVDWYTKAVLTVIALTLCWFSVKPLFAAKEISAQNGTVDVRIVGTTTNAFLRAEPIEVKIR